VQSYCYTLLLYNAFKLLRIGKRTATVPICGLGIMVYDRMERKQKKDNNNNNKRTKKTFKDRTKYDVTIDHGRYACAYIII